MSDFGAVGKKRIRRTGRGLGKNGGRFYRVKGKFEGLKIQIDQQKLHKEIWIINFYKQDKESFVNISSLREETKGAKCWSVLLC